MKRSKNQLSEFLTDLIAVAALAIALYIAFNAYQEGFSRDWASTKAKVKSVSIIKTESHFVAGSGIGGTSYSNCLQLLYEYSVDGRKHQSTRYSINSTTEYCNQNIAELKTELMPSVNSEIAIWYDKSHPEFSVRATTFPYANLVALLIAISISLCMFAYLWKVIFRHRKSRDQRASTDAL